MNKLIVLTILTLLIFNACRRKIELATEEDSFNKTELLTVLADNYILKKLSDFSLELTELESSVNEFNTMPSTLVLESVKNNWRKTNRLWKECSLFNIGEVKDTYAHLRIETRPENQSFIELIIADTVTLDSLYFETIGFSSKGLASIEYLLFHDEETIVINEFSQSRRKEYLKWAVNDIQKNLDLINSTWNGGYLEVFKTATTPGINSSINIVVNKLVELNEKIYQTKLGFPIGKKNGIIDATKTEAPLSKESLSFIESNLNSIEQPLALGLYNYMDYLSLEKGSEPLSDVIREQIQQIKTQLNSMSNLEDAIVNDYAQTELLYNQFKELLILLKVDVVSGLNIIFVINDNDGD